MAAVLVLVAGLVNQAFGTNLGLSVGASDIPLPEDFLSVFIIALVLGFLAGLCQLFSDIAGAKESFRKRKALYVGGGIGLLALLLAGVMFVAGGQLGLAVESGNTGRVKELLDKQSYDLDELDSHLYQALRNGYLEMAEALIGGGADIDHISGEFQTPLILSAVTFFPKESVDFLLEKGVNLERTDNRGRTAAHVLLAYRAGNLPQEPPEHRLVLLKKLHQKGLSLNSASEDGSTARSIAELQNLKWALEFLDKVGTEEPSS